MRIATPLDRNFSSLIVCVSSNKGHYITETEQAIGLKFGAKLVEGSTTYTSVNESNEVPNARLCSVPQKEHTFPSTVEPKLY